MNSKHSWNSNQYENTSDLQAAVADELINNLKIQPYENILDVGCGPGNITMNIASIAKKGRVLGIDDSSSMIAEAQKKQSLNKLVNISFRAISATELKIKKEFDVVLSNSVLHWVKNQDAALRAIYQSLKPRGRIGLQFPILDASHPMVSLVKETIHSLNFKDNYINWQFPWFVPESLDKYAEHLNQIQFKNVKVRGVRTHYTFKNTFTVLDFFKSVGLNLFLEPLSDKDRISFENELSNRIENYKNSKGISFSFNRLYAYANL